MTDTNANKRGKILATFQSKQQQFKDAMAAKRLDRSTDLAPTSAETCKPCEAIRVALGMSTKSKE